MRRCAAAAASRRFNVPTMLVSTKSRRAVRDDVRFVERRRVEHGMHAAHRVGDDFASVIEPTTLVNGPAHVQADDLVPVLAASARAPPRDGRRCP